MDKGRGDDVKTDRLASTTNPTTWSTFGRDPPPLPGKSRRDSMASASSSAPTILIAAWTSTTPYATARWSRGPRKSSISLDSYTEVSPSGTGVKIFLKSQMPGDRHKTKVQDRRDRVL